MNLRWLNVLGFAAATGTCVLSGCSDDTDDGAGTGGTSAGKGGSGGSSSVAGSAGTTGGTVGTAGSSAGTAGSSAGTAGSTAGTSGAGTGGAAGETGEGGTAGDAGGAAQGGEGGAGNEPLLIYDFETDEQGWSSSGDGVTVTTDAAQAVTGTKSLKVSVPALEAGQSRSVTVSNPPFWPGTVVEIHLHTPAGTDGLYVQVFSQSNNWAKWDTDGNAATTLVRGDWTTLTYTVPQTFPGGLQVVGVQLGVSDGGVAFAGGDFYIDSITGSGGDEVCEGEGAGTFAFESAGTAGWALAGTDTDTTVAQATTVAKAGTGSLQISFTDLPAGTVELPTTRRVVLGNPVAYCGQEVTFNVWMPAGSDDLTFQVFSQFNNWAGYDASALPATVTRDGWTELKYVLPAIGPGGLQALGIQILNTGAAAFTGSVYLDEVSW